MTDKEYAARIYCQVFNVEDDNGDAYTQGILAAIDTLKPREQAMLESYVRHGKTYKQTGEAFHLSTARAWQIVGTALRKLRHPKRTRDMSIARISVYSLGLSTRAANALTGAGKDTLQSILGIAKFAELYGIRNLGVKSRNEVITKMRDLGFREWAEVMDEGWRV